jgi:predicted nuclease with TOPRIM domain
LKKKVSLLAEQITTLEHEKSVLQTENAKLRKKVKNLEQHQLDGVKPKGELADDTVEVLKLLFEQDGLTVSQVARDLNMAHGMAEYHCGALRSAEMIGFPFLRTFGSENPNCMLQKGRAYLVKNGLV